MTHVEIKHFHLFCGLGGGAKGFNAGHARVGSMQAAFRCIGGVDVDSASIADFNRLTGMQGTVMDLFDREQYTAFHGQEPPAGWREATPQDIRRAASDEFPNIVFLSAPCKGFSGLLSQSKSTTCKYQALNRLTVRGVWLMLEAFKDDLPEFVIFENVPRIGTRGRKLLDQIVAVLRHYGYAVAETVHDCGELGMLAQSRKRFLLVARNTAKVPAFLYEPDKKPLQAVGTVLGRMPLPGDPAGGPMHRVPRLQWKTWVRLAFVEAGSDWRSLNRLKVEDGVLQDYLIVPEYHRGYLGVNEWTEPAGVVAGSSRATNGNFSIADPRFDQSAAWNDGHAYGVRDWSQPGATVTSKLAPGTGYGSVADPRPPARDLFGKYAITPFDGNAGTVIGGDDSGAYGVADPRPPSREDYKTTKYRMTGWDEAGGAVIAGSTSGNGAFAVADPRHHGPEKHANEFRIVEWDREAKAVTGAHGTGQCVADPRSGLQRSKGDHYLTGGHYGVLPWTGTAGAVSASAGHDNGPWSVADIRMPAQTDNLVAVIRALDGTWHRPFTTLELAALQGLVDPEEQLELDGLSDSAWRERIGNAVPPPSAAVIASVMGQAILNSRLGETFKLSAQPVWVRPIAVAVSVNNEPQIRGLA